MLFVDDAARESGGNSEDDSRELQPGEEMDQLLSGETMDQARTSGGQSETVTGSSTASGAVPCTAQCPSDCHMCTEGKAITKLEVRGRRGWWLGAWLGAWLGGWLAGWCGWVGAWVGG